MDRTLNESLARTGAVFGDGRDPHGTALHFGDARAEYMALTTGAGIADFVDRTQIELVGPDRQAFLHNLCTNEVRRLPPGAGCEAFFCNPQGHVLAFVYIFCGAESLVIETVAGEEAKLLAHLDRYLIREKVELRPRTGDWAELLLSGPGADALLASLSISPPQRLFDHIDATIGQLPVSLRRVDITLPYGYLLSCERGAAVELWEELRQRGAKPCGSQAVEMARIETFTPDYGRDISADNLPQEVARDARAISFVKGCYIGQETVARLDALGHVNRTLVGVRFEGESVPEPGTELTSEAGKVVGRVTSATFSPHFAMPLALAYVRREANQAGSKLNSNGAAAEVVTLPVGSD